MYNTINMSLHAYNLQHSIYMCCVCICNVLNASVNHTLAYLVLQHKKQILNEKSNMVLLMILFCAISLSRSPILSLPSSVHHVCSHSLFIFPMAGSFLSHLFRLQLLSWNFLSLCLFFSAHHSLWSPHTVSPYHHWECATINYHFVFGYRYCFVYVGCTQLPVYVCA